MEAVESVYAISLGVNFKLIFGSLKRTLNYWMFLWCQKMRTSFCWELAYERFLFRSGGVKDSRRLNPLGLWARKWCCCFMFCDLSVPFIPLKSFSMSGWCSCHPLRLPSLRQIDFRVPHVGSHLSISI